MLTAAADAPTVREALGHGVVNYLVKPFSDTDLAERLLAYARYRTHLSGDRPLDQAQIDRAARLLRQGDIPTGAQRKGRSTHTAQLVIETLRSAEEPLSAAEIASRVGISRPTAQRYLADLVEGRATITMRYGTTGRPEHRYRRRTDTPPPAP